MGGLHNRAALVVVSLLLIVLACDASSSRDPSSSAVAHQPPARVRKLLLPKLNTTSDCRGSGCPDEVDLECEEAVDVSQHDDWAPGPPGEPGVTACTSSTSASTARCTTSTSPASTDVVEPSDFRRVRYGDCIVRDGGAMGPGDEVDFEYSNSVSFPLEVASVSCTPP
ncbi:hypothetical protein ACP70R_019043 [Stipagrostis hirtigluma subsp. patula]